MSLNPFTADPEIRSRQERLAASLGTRVGDDIARLVSGRARHLDRNEGWVLLKQQAETLVARYELTGIEELMLLALGAAKTIARPPISNFFVGAVGLERETGNLIFGGNLEFPGTHLGFTVHGEGFVFTRAHSRGTAIEVLAIGEAHPCAHCRQYLSEFAATRDLVLIDPLGHRLTMAQLYPWPFDPDYLGQRGLEPRVEPFPIRELANHHLSPPVWTRLRTAGRRSYAPYSLCPGGVLLELPGDKYITGSAIESVAFNPTMGPLQAALIDLYAHGYEATDIVRAVLVTELGGKVDYSASTAELLGKIAPNARLTIVGWA